MGFKNLALTIRGAWEGAMFNRVPPAEGGGAEGQRLTNPFANSVWVQRAIKKIANPIAAVPLEFAAVQKDGTLADFTDARLAAFWEAPAVGLSRADFIEATVGWLKLAGESFWIFDDTILSNAEWAATVPFPNLPRALPQFIIARPDRMRQVVNAGKLTGWAFTDPDGHTRALAPEQVIQLKYWNPYDPWRGLSEYEAAAIATEADWLAGKFNLNLMRNNGDRGPYIIAKSGIPDDKQREQITNQIRMKKDLSLRGQFRPVFLAGDMTVEDPKVQAIDAAMISSRLENRHEIFLAFDVPPSMADVKASYSIGSASDRYALITEACMPTGAKIAGAISAVATRQSGVALRACFEWSEHPVMQQVITEKIGSAKDLVDRGMPWEKANDFLRLGMPEFPGWDIGRIPMNLVPVGEAGPLPSDDPAYAETTDETDPVELMRRALKGSPRTVRGHTSRTLAMWETLIARRKPGISLTRKQLSKVLFAARAETLANIGRFEVQGSGFKVQPGTGNREPRTNTKAAAADLVFNLTTFRDGLIAGLRKTAAINLQTAGDELMREIAKDDPFLMPPERVLTFMHGRINKLAGVADEVHAAIMGTLEDGLRAGDSLKDLAGAVREKFNEIDEGRARTIAVTETNAAYEFARHDSMQQAGVTNKGWLHSGNTINARPEHLIAGEQYGPATGGIPIDEPFVVDGEELMYPCDENGSPENTINCHCIAIALAASTPGDKT